MVGTQVEIRGGDGSHTPFRLGRERLRFVVAGGRGDDFVSVLVDGTSGGSSELQLFFHLFLDLRDLLSLGGRCRYLHTEDVSNLGLCK